MLFAIGLLAELNHSLRQFVNTLIIKALKLQQYEMLK